MAEYNADLARFEEWLGKPVNQGDWRWRSAAYVFLPWLDRLVRHPGILDAVESLIGPDILVFTSTFFIKEANSPTFAAWHQDATYFGIEPYEHVTAWVALSDATAEAGCMEVVSSRGRPQQLRHAALGLKDSINGGGQAITEDFDQGDGEMMALPAGQPPFHCTTRCAATARRRTAPRIAASASASAISRRIAGSPAPCACARRSLRGRDCGGHFDLLPPPEGEFHPAALARHEEAYRRYRANYAEQIEAHDRAFARVESVAPRTALDPALHLVGRAAQ